MCAVLKLTRPATTICLALDGDHIVSGADGVVHERVLADDTRSEEYVDVGARRKGRQRRAIYADEPIRPDFPCLGPYVYDLRGDPLSADNHRHSAPNPRTVARGRVWNPAAMAVQSAAIFGSTALGGGPDKDESTAITTSDCGATQSHWPNCPLQTSVTGAGAETSRSTWNELRNDPPGGHCAAFEWHGASHR